MLRVRIAAQLMVDVVRPEPADGHPDKVFGRRNPGEIGLRIPLGTPRSRRVPRRPEELADVVDVAAAVGAVPPLPALAVIGHEEALANGAVDVGVRQEEHHTEEKERLALEIFGC